MLVITVNFGVAIRLIVTKYRMGAPIALVSRIGRTLGVAIYRLPSQARSSNRDG